jgi:predicted TIM-barrel fold metal-dependent hydrolase
MRLIDIHTHVYPPAIARKAAASIREFYQLGTDELDGTTDTLLKKGDEAGIDRFVILPVAVRPDRTRHINDFILEQIAIQPRFIGFGTIHAGMESIAQEAEYIMEKKLKGIKMHPDTQAFCIDDERLFPAYEAIQGKLPVILHMGDVRYTYSHPARLRRVLELFPRLQVIAAHFGGYGMYETAKDLLYDKDCIFDVSSSMMFMEQGVAERYINMYGAERMAFGTDYPLWDPVKETKRFLELKLTDEQFEQIGHKTAERFLNL